MRLHHLLFVFCILIPVTIHAQCLNPDGVAGELMFNKDYDIFQGCTSRGWMAFHKLPPDCPHIGDTCLSDGTIYAGLSPDGNKPMYAMPTDSPAGLYSWNDGSQNWLDTAIENCPSANTDASSCKTGRANTAALSAMTGASPAPYQAAQYCANLIANSHDDWYLPALNELQQLYAIFALGKGNFTSHIYCSSSEYSSAAPWCYLFSNGNAYYYYAKSNKLVVRCVRQ